MLHRMLKYITPGLLQGSEYSINQGQEHLLMASGCDAACLSPAKAAKQALGLAAGQWRVSHVFAYMSVSKRRALPF